MCLGRATKAQKQCREAVLALACLPQAGSNSNALLFERSEKSNRFHSETCIRLGCRPRARMGAELSYAHPSPLVCCCRQDRRGRGRRTPFVGGEGAGGER